MFEKSMYVRKWLIQGILLNKAQVQYQRNPSLIFQGLTPRPQMYPFSQQKQGKWQWSRISQKKAEQLYTKYAKEIWKKHKKSYRQTRTKGLPKKVPRLLEIEARPLLLDQCLDPRLMIAIRLSTRAEPKHPVYQREARTTAKEQLHIGYRDRRRKSWH